MGYGVAVMRGPDWSEDYQDQDGGEEGVGTTTDNFAPDGWVWVQWENGNGKHYRVGAQGKYDLKMVKKAVAQLGTDELQLTWMSSSSGTVADALQAVKKDSADEFDLAPSVPRKFTDAVQAVKEDSAEELDLAPTVPGKFIEAVQAVTKDSADELQLAPDAVQAVKKDSADELDLAPSIPEKFTDAVQAVKKGSADELDLAPSVPRKFADAVQAVKEDSIDELQLAPDALQAEKRDSADELDLAPDAVQAVKEDAVEEPQLAPGIPRESTDAVQATGSTFSATFKPGKIGMSAVWSTGSIQVIHQGGQAMGHGVQVGMIIVGIDGEPYSEALLDSRIAGSKDYNISFFSKATENGDASDAKFKQMLVDDIKGKIDEIEERQYKWTAQGIEALDEKSRELFGYPAEGTLLTHSQILQLKRDFRFHNSVHRKLIVEAAETVNDNEAKFKQMLAGDIKEKIEEIEERQYKWTATGIEALDENSKELFGYPAVGDLLTQSQISKLKKEFRFHNSVHRNWIVEAVAKESSADSMDDLQLPIVPSNVADSLQAEVVIGEENYESASGGELEVQHIATDLSQITLENLNGENTGKQTREGKDRLFYPTGIGKHLNSTDGNLDGFHRNANARDSTVSKGFTILASMENDDFPDTLQMRTCHKCGASEAGNPSIKEVENQPWYCERCRVLE